GLRGCARSVERDTEEAHRTRSADDASDLVRSLFDLDVLDPDLERRSAGLDRAEILLVDLNRERATTRLFEIVKLELRHRLANLRLGFFRRRCPGRGADLVALGGHVGESVLLVTRDVRRRRVQLEHRPVARHDDVLVPVAAPWARERYPAMPRIAVACLEDPSKMARDEVAREVAVSVDRDADGPRCRLAFELGESIEERAQRGVLVHDLRHGDLHDGRPAGGERWKLRHIQRGTLRLRLRFLRRRWLG